MDVHSQGHHGAADVEVVGEGEDGDKELPDLKGAVVEQLHRLLRQVALRDNNPSFRKNLQNSGDFLINCSGNELNELIIFESGNLRLENLMKCSKKTV